MPAVLAAMLVGVVMTTSPPSVAVSAAGPHGSAPFAKPKPNGCVRKGDALGKDVNAHTINAKIKAMRLAGKSNSDIEAALARDWCITRISEAPKMQLASSSPSDVTWTLLTINYDNVSGWYYGYADWQWNNYNFHTDTSTGCTFTGRNIGGTDGMGLRLTGNTMSIKQNGYDATSWGNPALDSYVNDYGTYTPTQSTVNGHGVGYIKQDTWRTMENSDQTCASKWDLNTWAGSIVLGFEQLNGGCSNTQIYGDYVHTWDTTAVNSIGAGADGFTIGWANVGSSWPKQTAGQTAVVC